MRACPCVRESARALARVCSICLPEGTFLSLRGRCHCAVDGGRWLMLRQLVSVLSPLVLVARLMPA